MAGGARWRTLRALRRLALAEVRAHRARTIAAVLTLLLGSAVLTVTLVLAASLRTAIHDGVRVEYAGTDLVVRTQLSSGSQDAGPTSAAGGISRSAVRRVATTPGVARVASYTRASAVAQAGTVTRGITLDSLPEDPSFTWQRWSAGRAPRTAGEVGLTQATLDQLHIGLGDQVALGDPRVGRALFTVVGVVDVRGSLSYGSSAYGVVTGPVAQALLGIHRPDVLLIRTEPRADLKAVIDAINRRAPVGWPESTADLVAAATDVQGARADALGALVVGLAAVALVVAAVTLGTTTAASTRSRRRGLALTRCIGANRGHLVLLVLGEVMIPSLAGAALGMGLGVGLARLLLPLVGLLPGVPALAGDTFTVRPADVLVPMVAAAVLAVLGALVPAWLASRVPPSAALGGGARGDVRHLSALSLTAVAALVAAFGAWAALYGPVHGRPWLVVVGAVLVLGGAGLVLGPLLGLAARWLGRWARVPADRMALRDIVRRPSAAAAEAVAIVVAVGVLALSWVALTCIAATTSARLSASPLPDLVVGAPAGTPDIAAATQQQVARIDGVARVVAVRYGAGVTVEGRGDRGHVSLGVGTVAADPAVLGAALPGGFHPAALRSDTVYLPRTSFPPFPRGARVTLRGPAGAVHDLRVAYVAGLSVPSAVQPAMIERVTRHEPVRTLWVRVAPGADRARVVDEVDGAAVLGGELPVSGPLVDDVRVGDALAMARSASAGILAVAVLVGVVGAAATATLVVSERTREYAVLRALGLERRALGRLLLTRLVVVGSIASVVGVTTGTVLGLMVGRAVAHGLHLPTEFRLPLVPVVVIAVVTVLLVRAACLSPLDRASRIPPSRVLAKD